jgi:hypothetical protein
MTSRLLSVPVLPSLLADWPPDSTLLAGVLAEGWLGLPAGLLELLLGGGELLGGGGVCGCVGLLAVGQPLSSRHRNAVPVML